MIKVIGGLGQREQRSCGTERGRIMSLSMESKRRECGKRLRSTQRLVLAGSVNLCLWVDFKQGGEEAGVPMIKLDV